MSKTKLLQRYTSLGHKFDPDSIELQKSLRINTLKIDEQACVKRLIEKEVQLTPISNIPSCYYYTADFPLVSSEEYLLGYFYLQETASMVPSLVLLEDGNEPSAILDMCAAPGSKTTHLAQLTKNKIPIVALDMTLLRLKKLEFNLERLGVSAVISYRKDARFVFDLEKTFSHILLDAPCSGNFCIEEDFFELRTPRDFKDRARLQKELFRSAYSVLADNGVLVYSTCSLEPEEDELVIKWALETYDDLSLEIIKTPLGEAAATTVFGKELPADIAKARKFWPDVSNTQGFFIAKFRKKEE